MHVDDPGFKQVANAGPIHWAVTENGDLLVVPQTVGTEHIAPTVLTDGGPVVATGVAEIVVDDHGPYGIEISNQSRHFLTDQNSLAIGKQAFQAFGVTFLLEKDCRGDVDGKGSERLSQRQVGETWSQTGAWKLLENTHAQTLPEELATAKRLGVQPMHVDDPGFKQVANAGPIHWAVTQRGDLLVVPQTVGAEHIAPTVLTNGGPVRATGMADIAVDGKRAFGIKISNKSRHFLTDKKSLEIGKQAFQALGITFLLEKDCRGDVDGKGSERLSQRQVGADSWSQAGAWKLLENTHAQTLPKELETAKRLGVQPMHVDDPGFKQVANAGPIHWAVTQHGDLLVVPQTVGAEPIAPTVLTNGGPVLATGMADIAVDGKRAFGIKISNKSRHFLTDKKSLEIGKQAFQALGITFLVKKDTSGDVDGKGSERLSQRQVGETWSQAGAWKLLENTHAQTLPEELATAKRLGVQPMHVDDPGFKQVANAGPIHWAVTQHGDLLVVPQTVGAEPIAPTVLTNGGPVRATGMADIAVDGKRAFGIELSNQSRHFLTDKKSLEIGKQAFQALGITFLLEKDTSGNVKREGSNSSHERHDKHDENHGERQNRGGRDGNNGGNGGGHPVAYDGSSSESDEEQEKRGGVHKAALKNLFGENLEQPSREGKTDEAKNLHPDLIRAQTYELLEALGKDLDQHPQLKGELLGYEYRQLISDYQEASDILGDPKTDSDLARLAQETLQDINKRASELKAEIAQKFPDVNIQQKPGYVIDNRIPQVSETILSDSDRFTKTNLRVKGATVYREKETGRYYHLDTLHTGSNAEIEVYNPDATHLKTITPDGIDKGPAVPGRRLPK
jgi:hypothetical protein